MATSEFRSVELMDIGSLSGEAIFNDAINNLSRGVSGFLTIALVAPVIELATDEDDLSLYATLRFTGVLTEPCTVVAPARARIYILDNQTTGAFDLTFKTSAVGSSGVTLPQGGRALYYSDSTEVYAVAGGGAAGAGLVASANGAWNWDTATTGAPASGRMGINTTGVTAATELRLHELGSDGVDRATLLGGLQSQDEIYLQDKDTSANYVRYRFTAAGTDQGAWWTFPVAWVANGGAAFTLNQTVNVTFSLSTSFPRATTTQPGITVLADNPTTLAGLDATTAVTPASLAAKWATVPPTPPAASTTVVGVTRFATTAEGTAGVLNTVAMTPAGVQSSISAIPLASETVVGLAERATTTEILAGTDTTRFITPAGMQAKLNTLPVTPITGTALSVLRIPATGTGQEASPMTIAATGAVTMPATNTQTALTVSSEHSTTTGYSYIESYNPTGAGLTLFFRKATGTRAAPARQATAGITTMQIYGSTFARDPSDTYDGWMHLGNMAFAVESPDAQGRCGGMFTLKTTGLGAGNLNDVLRVTAAGNLLVGTTSFGSSLAKGVVLASGTAPTTGPADAVQLWTADRAGLAGKQALYIRAEAGTTHVLGDLVGIGTTTPAYALDVVGAINSSDAAGTRTNLGVSATPTGTAYSLLRLPSGGSGHEASPITVDASGVVVVKTTNAQPIWTWQAEHTTTTGGMYLEAYQPGSGAPAFISRKAKGTIAAPTRETTVGSGAFNLTGQNYARAADNLSDTWVGIGSLKFLIESADAQGRIGSFWQLSVNPGVSAPVVEALRVTQAGNLLLGLTTHGTGLTKGLALANGTAPSTSPADAVQLWVADRAATAGKAALHLRTEDGTQHVFGDLVGIGTTTPSVELDVIGTIKATGAQVDLLGIGRGVSTTAPTAPLVFHTVVGQKLLLYGDGIATRNGLGIASGVFQIFGQSSGRVDIGTIDATDGSTFNPILTVLPTAIGIGITAPLRAVHVVGTNSSRSGFRTEMWNTSATATEISYIRGRGAGPSVPEVLLDNDGIGRLIAYGYVRNAADTGFANVSLGLLDVQVDGVDAQGRAGGRLVFYTGSGVSAGATEKMRLTAAGNLLLDLTTHGTGLTNGLVLASGTAPTTSPADAVQLWVADAEGAAGKASLYLRSEGGAQHLLGESVGFFTTTPTSGFNVVAVTSYFERHDATATACNVITRKSRGTQAVPVRLVAGDNVSLLGFQGYVRNNSNTADTWAYTGRIDTVIESMDAEGRAGAALLFYTLPPVTTALVERMRITQDGHLGIGLAGPLSMLHVSHENVTTGQLILGSQRAAIVLDNVLGGVEFWSNDTNLTSPGVLTSYLRAYADETHTALALGTRLAFATTAVGAATPTLRMTLKSDGTLALVSGNLITLNESGMNKYGLTFGGGNSLRLFVSDSAGTTSVSLGTLSSTDGVTYTQTLRVMGTARSMILGAVAAIGTSGSGVFALSTGTAPTTAPADMVQVWAEDFEGTAGASGLHILNEQSYKTKIGYGITTRAALYANTTATIAAPYLLGVDESNKVLLSNGAAMVQFTLPLAATGLQFHFIVYIAAGCRVRANTGDFIRLGATTGTTAGAIESTTVGSTLTLIALNGSTWQAFTVTGTWALIA